MTSTVTTVSSAAAANQVTELDHSISRLKTAGLERRKEMIPKVSSYVGVNTTSMPAGNCNPIFSFC